MPYRLVITDPQRPKVDHAVILGRSVVLVGRRDGCEVQLPHLRVGGVHLRLERDGEIVYAVDAGTPGGTSLGGAPLTPGVRRALRDGEIIDVAGVFLLRYEAKAPGGAKTTTGSGTAQIARAMVLQLLDSVGEPSRRKTPSLIVESGPAAGQRFELSTPGQALVLGRAAETCDAPLLDPDLSREHARVQLDADGAASVSDLGSKNGTSVEGRRLEPGEEYRLGHRAKIQLGATVLRFDDPLHEYLAKLGDTPDEQVRDEHDHHGRTNDVPVRGAPGRDIAAEVLWMGKVRMIVSGVLLALAGLGLLWLAVSQMRA